MIFKNSWSSKLLKSLVAPAPAPWYRVSLGPAAQSRTRWRQSGGDITCCWCCCCGCCCCGCCCCGCCCCGCRRVAGFLVIVGGRLPFWWGWSCLVLLPWKRQVGLVALKKADGFHIECWLSEVLEVFKISDSRFLLAKFVFKKPLDAIDCEMILWVKQLNDVSDDTSSRLGRLCNEFFIADRSSSFATPRSA